MLTPSQYFGASVVAPEIADNAKILLEKVNAFLEEFSARHPETTIRMSSGYRSPAHNAKIGGAKLSNHMSGKAIDIVDYDRRLAKFCISHVPLLEAYALYCEDPRATSTWVHFQSVQPKSGMRFFIPSAEWAAKISGPLTLESL